MILLGLHILNPEQLLMGSLGRKFLFVFVAFLAFVMILRGKNTLRMRYKAYPEDDGRWLKGRVIRVERAMTGFGRYREGRRIVVEYSDNGLLYYLHRDTHVYRINKCPKRGDEVDILFSSILTKAITRAEIKDAKYKIFKGVLILVLILLLWLYYFFR